MYKLIERYFVLSKMEIMKAFSYKASYFINLIGNVLYLIVVFYLWKAIFSSSPNNIVNGMTYVDTVFYLVLANALYNLCETNLVWDIGNDIQTGAIVVNLIKPMKYPIYEFFKHSGKYVVSFFTVFLPTMLILAIISKDICITVVNSLLFAFSITLSILMNYIIDFITSIFCVYSHSIWGVNIFKETVVLLLSGAMIPVAFFPPFLQQIIYFLPFQAIYNLPIRIIMGDYSGAEIGIVLCIQLFWLGFLLILGVFLWKKALKQITVNGG